MADPGPTELSATARGPHLELGKDKLTVRYTGDGRHDVGAIQVRRRGERGRGRRTPRAQPRPPACARPRRRAHPRPAQTPAMPRPRPTAPCQAGSCSSTLRSPCWTRGSWGRSASGSRQRTSSSHASRGERCGGLIRVRRAGGGVCRGAEGEVGVGFTPKDAKLTRQPGRAVWGAAKGPAGGWWGLLQGGRGRGRRRVHAEGRQAHAPAGVSPGVGEGAQGDRRRARRGAGAVAGQSRLAGAPRAAAAANPCGASPTPRHPPPQLGAGQLRLPRRRRHALRRERQGRGVRPAFRRGRHRRRGAAPRAPGDLLHVRGGRPAGGGVRDKLSARERGSKGVSGSPCSAAAAPHGRPRPVHTRHPPPHPAPAARTATSSRRRSPTCAARGRSSPPSASTPATRAWPSTSGPARSALTLRACSRRRRRPRRRRSAGLTGLEPRLAVGRAWALSAAAAPAARMLAAPPPSSTSPVATRLPPAPRRLIRALSLPPSPPLPKQHPRLPQRHPRARPRLPAALRIC
jgi:hypothetical protein